MSQTVFHPQRQAGLGRRRRRPDAAVGAAHGPGDDRSEIWLRRRLLRRLHRARRRKARALLRLSLERCRRSARALPPTSTVQAPQKPYLGASPGPCAAPTAASGRPPVATTGLPLVKCTVCDMVESFGEQGASHHPKPLRAPSADVGALAPSYLAAAAAFPSSRSFLRNLSRPRALAVGVAVFEECINGDASQRP